MSVNPSDMVVTRYDTGRSSKENYWYGYEASASIVENYLYVSENGGEPVHLGRGKHGNSGVNNRAYRICDNRGGLNYVVKDWYVKADFESAYEEKTYDFYYGKDDPTLPPADYKLVKHLADETVYTFCMCPGGYVVAATSEEGSVVTNGMSYADRDGDNANAALLITVNPKDFPGEDPLAGMYWQRMIEERAYAAGGSNYHAPAQLVGDFMAGRPSTGPGAVQPTYRPGVHWCDLHEVLPARITEALAQALPQLDQNLKGFADGDAEIQRRVILPCFDHADGLTGHAYCLRQFFLREVFCGTGRFHFQIFQLNHLKLKY